MHPGKVTTSSMSALQDKYLSITRNMANVSTNAYKRRRTSFASALQQQGITSETAIDFSQGPMVQTGRSLDVAINGKAFFVIETPDGPLYSRNGTFRTNASGKLVDDSGNTVAGTGGPIIIPTGTAGSQISVSLDGTISAAGQTIGKLKLVDFKNLSDLIPAGGGKFAAAPSAAPTQAKDASVMAGYKEGSNVNIVEELVNLITVSRLYEANAKTVSRQDERIKNLISVMMS